MTRTYISRRMLVLAAAVAVLPIAACDTDANITPTAADVRITAPQSTTIAPPTSTPELTDAERDRIFLKVVGDAGVPATQEAIDTAHAICDALDAGNSPESVALVVVNGFDGDIDKAGALLGAGVEAYCPQHSDDLAAMGGDPA